VTTTADAGAGSLRQTMLDAESCGQDERCRIVFAPEITSIRVLSPLPVIHARNVWIDGSYGRTSKMAIDGSTLTSGNGIVFGPEVAQGRALGLAIHSFPGNGIECRGQCRIESNFIGLDRDGITPRGNGARGVYVSGGCEIENNVISGNWRSGIFVDGGGSGYAHRNLIGVAADGVTPIGNGASGLYVGPQSFSFRTFIAEDNVIAYSTHFGVAIAPGQIRVIAPANRFIGNRQSDIDVGLDGVNRPGLVLRTAQYDGESHSTFIFGEVANPDRQTVSLYAAGTLLGSLDITQQKSFMFRAAGDQTGKPLSGSLLIEAGDPEFMDYRTTEMSESLVPAH
jgi:parallel beta-helix repeat protein